MKPRSLFASLAVALMASSFAGGAADAQVNLKLSTYVNAADIRVRALEYFAEQVKERTSGRVTVEVFPASALHPHAKALDALQGGVSDIGSVSV